MTDTFIIFFIILAAIRIGWIAREWWAKKEVNQLQDELSDNLFELQNHLIKNCVNLKMEKIGDVIYVYDMKDDSFVCQGKDREEILVNFNKRYPNKKGLIHEGGDIWKQI